MSTENDTCIDCGPGQSASHFHTHHDHHAASKVTASTSAPAAATDGPTAVAAADIVPPTLSTPHVLIEYCDRCRWAPRASWIQTELLLTFPYPLIKTITLQPMTTPETGGRFRVWVNLESGEWQLVWDRKTEGGFPELKVLKQRIRNLVQPDMNLGHSDVKKH